MSSYFQKNQHRCLKPLKIHTSNPIKKLTKIGSYNGSQTNTMIKISEVTLS